MTGYRLVLAFCFSLCSKGLVHFLTESKGAMNCFQPPYSCLNFIEESGLLPSSEHKKACLPWRAEQVCFIAVAPGTCRGLFL